MSAATVDDERTVLDPASTPVPFRRLLRVEWRKTLDTPAARWLLVVTAAATVVSLAIAVVLTRNGLTPVTAYDDVPVAAYLSAMSFGVGLLLPVVPLLSITSEWSMRTATVTFTQEPRRLRVLAAKTLCGLLLGAVAAVLCAVTAVGVELAHGTPAAAVDGRIVIGFMITVMLGVMMGIAYAAALQSTPAAVIAIISPSLVLGLLAQAGALGGVRDWIDINQALGWILEARWDGRLSEITTVFVVWMVVPLAIGTARWIRRPVT